MIRDLRKNWRRIVRAAVVSLLGVASMYVWRSANVRQNRSSNRDAIAILVRAVNEVERKPERRVIWEPLEEQELLFPGESVRTSEIGEASIKLIKGGAQIELEPDSLITLNENAGNLALNCLKGKLFVSESGGGEQNDVQITSGSKTLNVADLKKSGGSISAGEESKEASLKILGPLPYKTAYLNTGVKEKLPLEFEKLDDSYTVVVETGPTPKKMKPMKEASAGGVDGAVKAPVKVGPFYWRLTATSTDPKKPMLRSPIQKNEVVARIPPTLLEPTDKDIVLWTQEEPKVTFRWSNPSRLENVSIEVATDKEFKSGVAKQDDVGQSEFEAELANTGTYYWRVRGRLRGAQEKLESEIFSFQYKKTFELLPPELLKPAQNEHISHQVIATAKLTLKWEEVPGATKYKLSLKPAADSRTPSGSEAIEEDVRIPEFKAAGLQAGAYVWSVASVGKDGKLSASSPERKFFVEQLPRMQWADNQDGPLNYLYTTDKPSVKLEWPKAPAQAKSWKVRVVEDGVDAASVKWSEPVTEPQVTREIPKQGKYLAEIEALDEKGEVVARSSRRVINVQLMPLLPAPKFAEGVPDNLVAKNNGTLQLNWNKVEHASGYVVEIRKGDGTVAKELQSVTTAETLRSMMPGQYKVVLRSMDHNGRRGPASEERPLLVPDRSDARAPKIKAIKVK